MTNLLIAIANIVKNPITDVIKQSKNSNRVNAAGDALEFYIKDVFCDSLKENNALKKNGIYDNYFSYLGAQNSPPDIIVKNGDAIEVKKLESIRGGIALNSSYPKNKLYNDDSRISNACKNCEASRWTKKDIIYAIGIIPKNTNKLRMLWFVYGTCYAAERTVYKRIFNPISLRINETPDIHFEVTNELAKVNKVDPLGITDFRVRGMWHIKNPIKVFEDFVSVDKNKDFMVNTFLLEKKYLSFPKKDRQKLENLQNKNFFIRDVKIKSPDNPAKLLKAKFICYAK